MTRSAAARVCLGAAHKAGRQRHILKMEKKLRSFFPSVLPHGLTVDGEHLAKSACLRPTVTTAPTNRLPAPGGSQGFGGDGWGAKLVLPALRKK